MFTEAVQKFSQMLFMHLKPVKINVYSLLTNEFNLNLRLHNACSTKPTVLNCTYSVLSLSRIKKEANETKAKNQTKKRHSCVIFLPQFSNIWGQHIKTGFHKSQGTKIRRTDWSTPILIQLINAQPEKHRASPKNQITSYKRIYLSSCEMNLMIVTKFSTLHTHSS